MTTKKNNAQQKTSEDILHGVEGQASISLAGDSSNRRQIALDTLERYSGSSAKSFQKFVLLTNFPRYVESFAEQTGAKITTGSVLKVAHCRKTRISMIDYRVGAPMAALVIDVLSYIQPQVVLMLGMCGGLHHRQKVGNFLVPTAAIRDEGASQHYMPNVVPSLPALMVQHFVAQTLLAKQMLFYSGVVHTTDYRMWEFDAEFKHRLKQEKASAIDMECSALFTVGFAKKVPVGALMLISDLPVKPGGIKTQKSAQRVFNKYTDLHLSLGINSLTQMQQANQKKTINFRHYQFL